MRARLNNIGRSKLRSFTQEQDALICSERERTFNATRVGFRSRGVYVDRSKRVDTLLLRRSEARVL